MVTWSHLRNMNDLACSSWLEPSLRQLCPQVKNHLHPLPVYSMSARTTNVRPLDGCSHVQSAPVPPDQRLYLRSTHLLQGQHLHCARGCGLVVIVGFTSPAPFLHPFSSLQSLWLSMSWQQHSKLARFTAPTCCVVCSITVDSANVASFDLHPVGVTTPCLKLSHLCQVL